MHLLKNRVEPEISVRDVEILEMVGCPKSLIRLWFSDSDRSNDVHGLKDDSIHAFGSYSAQYWSCLVTWCSSLQYNPGWNFTSRTIENSPKKLKKMFFRRFLKVGYTKSLEKHKIRKDFFIRSKMLSGARTLSVTLISFEIVDYIGRRVLNGTKK